MVWGKSPVLLCASQSSACRRLLVRVEQPLTRPLPPILPDDEVTSRPPKTSEFSGVRIDQPAKSCPYALLISRNDDASLCTSHQPMWISAVCNQQRSRSQHGLKHCERRAFPT